MNIFLYFIPDKYKPFEETSRLYLPLDGKFNALFMLTISILFFIKRINDPIILLTCWYKNDLADILIIISLSDNLYSKEFISLIVLAFFGDYEN